MTESLAHGLERKVCQQTCRCSLLVSVQHTNHNRPWSWAAKNPCVTQKGRSAPNSPPETVDNGQDTVKDIWREMSWDIGTHLSYQFCRLSQARQGIIAVVGTFDSMNGNKDDQCCKAGANMFPQAANATSSRTKLQPLPSVQPILRVIVTRVVLV